MRLEELSKNCERLFREGRYAEAITACEETLARKLGAQARCNVLVMTAQAYSGAKGPQSGQAVAYLKEAVDVSAKDSTQRGQVLAALTAAYGGVGNVEDCRSARNAFVQLNKLNPSPSLARLLPDVEYNLALAYHELGRLDEAMRYYTAAMESTLGSTDEYVLSLQPVIQHNLVDIFQEHGETEIARRIMEHWFNSLDDVQWGARKRHRWAIQGLLEGDLESAVLLAESGLGHPSCDPQTRAALTLTKARIAHANGNMTAAHEYSDEALRLAQSVVNLRLSDRATAFLQKLQRGV